MPEYPRFDFQVLEPLEAIALFRLNKLTSEDMVLLAQCWLNRGIYTDSLNQMAWEKTPIRSTVGPLFEQALVELELGKVTFLEAARIQVRSILLRIVAEDILPDIGAELLYWEVYHEMPDSMKDSLGLNQFIGIYWELSDWWDYCDPRNPQVEIEQKLQHQLMLEAQHWLEINDQSKLL
ncbi:hypothetical protein F1728_00415 [Gimesia benthica]|uniref:Uncharacterized protein n=1 Tax=Gimesia benthica TaxID=2608982 RepID=A0A6I6A7B9_9PLAN|nr:hypothetical protein [Gimesia benthica]QGQ21255.1 hypothetical protein F1728_00415 [Gimesia benthica]